MGSAPLTALIVHKRAGILARETKTNVAMHWRVRGKGAGNNYGGVGGTGHSGGGRTRSVLWGGNIVYCTKCNTNPIESIGVAGFSPR